jgi:hypothetical protein
MANAIILVCPECQKEMKAPAEVEGKKVRCKGCEHVFVARAGQSPARAAPAKPPQNKAAKGKSPPAKSAAPPPAASGDEDEYEGTPYGLTDTSLAPRCPECANELDPPDAVVCLHCGYNTITRQRAMTRKVYDTSAGNYFIWLLPGILCVIGVLCAIGFALWYVFKIEEAVNPEEFPGNLLSHSGIKLWVVIMCLFVMFYSGHFAFKRLVLNYKPPEVEKY